MNITSSTPPPGDPNVPFTHQPDLYMRHPHMQQQQQQQQQTLSYNRTSYFASTDHLAAQHHPSIALNARLRGNTQMIPAHTTPNPNTNYLFSPQNNYNNIGSPLMAHDPSSYSSNPPFALLSNNGGSTTNLSNPSTFVGPSHVSPTVRNIPPSAIRSYPFHHPVPLVAPSTHNTNTNSHQNIAHVPTTTSSIASVNPHHPAYSQPALYGGQVDTSPFSYLKQRSSSLSTQQNPPMTQQIQSQAQIGLGGPPSPAPPVYNENLEKKDKESEADRYLQYKTNLCRAFEVGQRCHYGQGCLFAHGPSELRTIEMNAADGIHSHRDVIMFRAKQAEAQYLTAGVDTSISSSANPAPFSVQKPSPEVGQNEAGDEGGGKSDERPPPAAATGGQGQDEINKYLLYKTAMCRAGPLCTFGNDCMFAHNESELRTIEMNVADRLYSQKDIVYFQRKNQQQQQEANTKVSTPNSQPIILMRAITSAPSVSSVPIVSFLPTSNQTTSVPNDPNHASMLTSASMSQFTLPHLSSLSGGNAVILNNQTSGHTLSAASAQGGGTSNPYCSSSAASSHYGQFGNSVQYPHSASGSVASTYAAGLVPAFFDPSLPSAPMSTVHGPSPFTPNGTVDGSRSGTFGQLPQAYYNGISASGSRPNQMSQNAINNILASNLMAGEVGWRHPNASTLQQQHIAAASSVPVPPIISSPVTSDPRQMLQGGIVSPQTAQQQNEMMFYNHPTFHPSSQRVTHAQRTPPPPMQSSQQVYQQPAPCDVPQTHSAMRSSHWQQQHPSGLANTLQGQSSSQQPVAVTDPYFGIPSFP